jgi:chromosome segregation ATPase
VAETMKKDSTINLLFQAFNEIEENLEMIKSKQAVISQNAKDNPEKNPNVRDRINEDIKIINDLMDRNKRAVASLNKKLKAANMKLAEFEKTIARMNKQIEEKDGEINTLKDNLTKMNFKVEELNARLDTAKVESQKKTEVIESKTAELNTAYYVFGTKKELVEKGIITKTGGFIGIGKGKKLSDDINKSYLTKVDITKLKEIPLNVKKAEIVTAHASSSYRLESKDKKVEKLVIVDAAKFWEASKILVIIVD